MTFEKVLIAVHEDPIVVHATREWGADVIVVGGVTGNVTRHASWPVLIVRAGA